MLYKAIENGKIEFLGNKIHDKKIIDIDSVEKDLLEDRVQKVRIDETFYHINEIDNGVFNASVLYFNSIKANWVNLPLTTRMISSPGEVYAGQTLDYTTDALPVELPNWFDSENRIFLAESSQFYLELNLLMKQLDKVYSIYNSFRKEESDATHLSEFQHIEFEGKLDNEGNIDVFM
jgi:aspartyl/asparaginyl-tRNA synthetase